MKSQTLPVKRRPVSNGILRRLSAVTRNRKQRAAASASAADMEADDGSSKISRALIIIFLIHIVAIGLIFIHQRFLDGRSSPLTDTAAQATTAEVTTTLPAPSQRADLPRLTTGDRPYIVRAGDNYARIASAEGVDEAKLRLVNKHVNIGPGLILKIPPKHIVAVDPPEVTAIRQQALSDHDRGLVEAVPVEVAGAPRARPARPARPAETREAADHVNGSAAAASGKSYVVQAGDSVWRIANRYKVSQDTLMRANGISDVRKLHTGMKLVIP